jgi:hypothetical protein
LRVVVMLVATGIFDWLLLCHVNAEH